MYRCLLPLHLLVLTNETFNLFRVLQLRNTEFFLTALFLLTVAVFLVQTLQSLLNLRGALGQCLLVTGLLQVGINVSKVREELADLRVEIPFWLVGGLLNEGEMNAVILLKELL